MQLLQEKVLTNNPDAMPKLLSLMRALTALPDTAGGLGALSERRLHTLYG